MITVKWPSIEAATKLEREKITTDLVESLELEYQRLVKIDADILQIQAIKTALSYYGLNV